MESGVRLEDSRNRKQYEEEWKHGEIHETGLEVRREKGR